MNQQNQLKSFIARITAALVFILIAYPTEVRADDSGYCGDPNVNDGKNVTWLYVESTKTLTISGRGAMADYAYNAPWKNYQKDIQTVVIKGGVTSIGEKAFIDCRSLSSVTIPSSVTSIGEIAFYACASLSSVNIPSSVTSIGNDAFYGCMSLSSVTIPYNVTNIGGNAFKKCSSLKKIYVLRDNPPTLGGAAFDNTPTDLEIWVYSDALDTYKSANKGWISYESKLYGFSGYCGNSSVNDGKEVIWNLTDEDNDGTKETLTITGTGEMKNFKNSDPDKAPWDNHRDKIQTVVIEEGVRRIGELAFKGCTNLKRVNMLRYDANSDLKFTELYNINAFEGTPTDLEICVPFDALDAYTAATNWSSYADKIISQNGAICFKKDNNGMHATLDDNYTGTAAINITSDIKVADVTLNREFTAGVYSTIVLPFGVSTSNLSGIESIAQFSGVEKDNNDVWTASMTELWNDESTSDVTLSAYTPYVVKMKVGTLSLTGLTDVVTLKKTVKPETTDGDWTFVGTLAPTALPIDGEHDYGFAGSSNADNSVSAGDFVHLVSGASAKPFRAYLKYTGTDTNWAKTRSNEPMPSRIQVQILKLNGQATAIGTLDTRTGEISSDEWYSIDGRRLSGKPNSKGIYINHGKKVVVN